MESSSPLRLTVLLGNVQRVLEAGVQAKLTAVGYGEIRPRCWTALAWLRGGATAAWLGRQLKMTRQSANELVADLVARELADRSPHPADRRAIAVTLTGHGARVLSMAEDGAVEVVRRWHGVVPPERLEQLQEDLGRITILDWYQQRRL